MNTKDERIAKLFKRGVSLHSIARKLGMPENLERIKSGLLRKGLVCTQCRMVPATSPHTCPFAEEINQSDETCECCKDCTHECAMDI